MIQKHPKTPESIASGMFDSMLEEIPYENLQKFLQKILAIIKPIAEGKPSDAWQEKLAVRLIESVLPEILPQRKGESSHGRAGRLVGMLLGLALHLRHAAAPLGINADQEPQVASMLRNVGEGLMQLIPPAMQENLSLGLDATGEFWSAFGKSVQRIATAKENSICLQSTTSLYFFMLFSMETISHFSSMPQLHAFLRSQLPTSVVGSQKRLEKVCQSIGLRFASRGRPRKIRKS